MRSRSSKFVTALVALLLGLAGAAALPSSALARREQTFSYPFSRVWTTAVRLLRVDFECPITEKDRDEGYFLFSYTDSGTEAAKAVPGSVELVTSHENGVEQVRVVIQVPAMPSYVEAMMLDHLERKLQEDFGSPKGTPEAPKPDAPKPDAPGNPPAGGGAAKPAAPKPAPKPAS